MSARINDLNKRQIELLALSQGFFPFSAKAYASHFSVSGRTARMDIKGLCNKDLLVATVENKKHLYNKKR